MLIALLVSLAIGAFNGWLLHITGLPSFLVTLGTFFVLQGVNLAVTRIVAGGRLVEHRSATMDGFGSAQAVFASSFQIGSVDHQDHGGLLDRSSPSSGRCCCCAPGTATGSSPSGGDAAAARAVGVPVTATKIALFMGVGLCAWLLGMHKLFNYNNVQSGQGVGNEFIYIIAAVIGGCLLTGGYGSVVGASIGALIFGMTQLGITYAGWNPDWFKTFLGIMLILRDAGEPVRQAEGGCPMSTIDDRAVDTATDDGPSRCSSWTTSARATATCTPFAA